MFIRHNCEFNILKICHDIEQRDTQQYSALLETYTQQANVTNEHYALRQKRLIMFEYQNLKHAFMNQPNYSTFNAYLCMGYLNHKIISIMT